jgi:hypothetical protein
MRRGFRIRHVEMPPLPPLFFGETYFTSFCKSLAINSTALKYRERGEIRFTQCEIGFTTVKWVSSVSREVKWMGFVRGPAPHPALSQRARGRDARTS